MRRLKGAIFLIILTSLFSACSSVNKRTKRSSIYSQSIHKLRQNRRSNLKPFEFIKIDFDFFEQEKKNSKIVPALSILRSSEKSLNQWEKALIETRKKKENSNKIKIITNSWWIAGQQINGAFKLDNNYSNWEEVSEVIYGNQFHAENLIVWNAGKKLKLGNVIYYSSPFVIQRDRIVRLVDEYDLRHPQVKVKRGDSLSTIAQNTLGSADRWEEIYKLNRWIYNPDEIEIGQIIKMPFYNIKNRTSKLRDEHNIVFSQKFKLNKSKYSKQLLQRFKGGPNYAKAKVAQKKSQLKNLLYKYWKDSGIQASFLNKKSTPAWLSESAFHRWKLSQVVLD